MNLKSRMYRVKDSRKIADYYGTNLNNTEDDAWETANYLMEEYSDLEDGVNYNNLLDCYELIDKAIDLCENTDIPNPEAVYDILENENYHTLNWCLCLSGKLADGIEDAVRFFSDKNNIKFITQSKDCRRKAIVSIMCDMGLLDRKSILKMK